MDHSTCDSCGRQLLVESEVRYEVAIEVKAAYDPLEISADDLNRDYRAEIARALRQLEGLSAEEAENGVYLSFAFDLCPAAMGVPNGSLTKPARPAPGFVSFPGCWDAGRAGNGGGDFYPQT